jgi:acetyl-CoA carboxylase carboxyltransferase component/biotin carboxyl carrier protein
VAHVPLRPIGRPLSEIEGSATIAARTADAATRDAELSAKITTVHAGWGPSAAARVHEKGKRTTWERLARLVDPGTEVLSLLDLVNWGRSFAGSKRDAPGAGVVTALGVVQGRRVVIIANDNTVASGSWWPLSPEKIERAQSVALALGAPVLYLVDCSGLFLPEQAHSFPGARGAGHIFKMNALLAARGVPQIAGVFGDCIAGGGYMPIISDRVVMTECAYMVIAGAALIKGAKALHLTSLDIGGPEVHVHQSGCADMRVPGDDAAIDVMRREVARLPTSAVPFYRGDAEAAPPAFDPAELSALVPSDHRHVYDMREVLARLVDDSLAWELLPDRGREMITVVARISGLWVGLVANNLEPTAHPDEPARLRAGGILYRDGIAKISAFARACSEDGLPLVWLQDIAGFDIGVEAEAQGLLGYGSSLIYSNSTTRAPTFTVLLRKASGAGYYAMAGLPYDPVVQLSTPLSRLAVMEGRTLAIAAFSTKLDDQFEIASTDPAERTAIADAMAETASRIERDMDPVAAAARMDTDQVVPLARLRPYLEALVEMAWQRPRPLRNPRIWSLHDLAALTRATVAGAATVARAAPPPTQPGETGLVGVRVGSEGSAWSRPSPRDPQFCAPGDRVEPGTRVALVEVMKTFAPVPAGVAGTFERYAVPDGSAVAPGNVVAWIRPGGPGAMLRGTES